SHQRDGRLLCARRERPCDRGAAEQRDELAPFQSIELHPLPLAKADSITDWRRSSHGLAALRDFVSAGVRSGSIASHLDPRASRGTSAIAPIATGIVPRSEPSLRARSVNGGT